MRKILLLLLSLTLTFGVASAISGCVDLTGAPSTESSNKAEETFTVTFKQDGQKDVEVEVESGEGIAEDKLPKPVAKEGYTIVWDVTDFSKITKDMTVNAVATANTYTITYNANGGEASTATQTVTYDQAPGALATATRTGFTFVAWTLDNKAVLGTEVWKHAKNVTLVAQWQEVVANTCTISFVQDGYATINKTVTKGQSLAQNEIPPIQPKTGYNVAWENKNLTNVTADIIVYAVSTPKEYTITLNLDGGTGDTTFTMTYDKSYTLPTPTKEGFTFDGWKDAQDANFAGTGTWQKDATITLTAKWIKNEEPAEMWTPNY